MLDEKINEILCGAKGAWGVFAKDLKSGETIFEHNQDEWFPAASTSKVSICLYALHQIETKQEDPTKRFLFSETLKLGGSGILQFIDEGLNPTILDIIKFCLILSDNTAAKMLVKHFSPQTINKYLVTLGLVTTNLKIEGDTFGYGLTTPKEMAKIFEGIYTNRFLNQANSSTLLEILKKTNHDTRIRRLLPRFLDSRSKERLRVASKGGTIPGVCNDVGIVFGEHPFVLSIYSKDLPDESFGPDNPVQITIAKIAKAVYEYVSNPKV